MNQDTSSSNSRKHPRHGGDVNGQVDDDTSNPKDKIDLPTHRVSHATAGNNSVQMLVSTKEHLYIVDDANVGDGSWQVVGAWDETSISNLCGMVSQYHRDAAQNPTLTAAARSSAFNGSGIRLGDPVNRPGGPQ